MFLYYTIVHAYVCVNCIRVIIFTIEKMSFLKICLYYLIFQIKTCYLKKKYVIFMIC